MDAVESIKVNGKTYYSTPSTLASLPASLDFVGMAIAAPLPDSFNITFEHHSFKALIAINGPSHIFLNWLSHMHSLDGIDTSSKLVTYSTTHTPIDALAELPFILNIGIICHISPIKLDFKSLCPIAPHLTMPTMQLTHLTLKPGTNSKAIAVTKL